MIGGAEDLDSAPFAVVADGDAEVGLLIGGKGIADGSDGADEFVPADLFAQVSVLSQGEVAQRARGRYGNEGAEYESADGEEADIEDELDGAAVAADIGTSQRSPTTAPMARNIG